MEEPVAGPGTSQTDLQIEQFAGLFAAGTNSPWAMQSRRYAEGIPGTISEILRLIDNHDMLSWHAGKRRSHPNGSSIGFQHQHPLSAQPCISFANPVHVGADAFSYKVQHWPLSGIGEVPVDRQFDLRIEAHRLRSKNQEV